MSIPIMKPTVLRDVVVLPVFRPTRIHKQHLKAEMPMLFMSTFKFAQMRYGPSITSATGTTLDKGSTKLEESQVVSADSRFVQQLWS